MIKSTKTLKLGELKVKSVILGLGFFSLVTDTKITGGLQLDLFKEIYQSTNINFFQ